MGTEVFEKYESAVRSYCRHFPTVFTKAKGAVITDQSGREYVDFFCGAGAVNYGHNNPYINEKLIDYLQSDGILHGLDMYTAPKEEFINALEQKIIRARGYDYVIQFTGPTGTNAMEAALKLARKVKKRQNIFAFMGCFHGMTLGALALTTDRDARQGAGRTLDGCTHIPAPYMFEGLDVLQYMQTLIDDDHSGVEKPAALVMETVQAEGGIHVFEPEFLRGVRKFCDDNDILLIVDDIQVGCCRSGKFFSFERAGIMPDMVVMSKSIGGCGLPLAIVLIRPELDIWKPGEHNGTFRGNQLAFIAGAAAIDYLLENRVESEVERKGEIVRQFIEKEILPINSNLSMRGIGLIWGIECEKCGGGAMADEIANRCFEKNLILERAGRDNSVVKIMPPLIIEDELLMKGLNLLRDAVKELLG